MTKEDILEALRITAMGRANSPQQEELAEKLAAVFARDQQQERVLLADALECDDLSDVVVVLDGPTNHAEAQWAAPKPKRKKAD